MGLFKWHVHLGEYGEFIADGWVMASSVTEAEEKVKRHYTNCYHTVSIEDDYDFLYEDDFNLERKPYWVKEYDDGVIVRWED